MTGLDTNGPWTIEGRRDTVLAVLPPLIFGLGIALSALSFAGDKALWKVALSVGMVLVPSIAIAIGAVIAVIRRLPDWGYTWLGAFLMGVLVSLNLVADEMSESGRHIISPVGDTVLALVVLAIIAVALFAAAWRGWQRAGLMSIGLSSIFGLSMCGSVNAAPFYRYDLASLAFLLGALIALLTYVYIRQRDFITRIAVIAALGALNAVFIWIINQAWTDWLVSRGRPSPLVPMVVLLLIVLLSGPVVGLITRTVRPLLGRA